MTAILVVGLPGSGKTTLLKKKYNDPSKYLLFDDHNFGTTDLNRIHSLSPDITIVVADPRMCNRRYYDYLVNIFSKTRTVETIFLQTSLEECKNNIMKRETDLIRRDKFIFSEEYFASISWIKF